MDRIVNITEVTIGQMKKHIESREKKGCTDSCKIYCRKKHDRELQELQELTEIKKYTKEEIYEQLRRHRQGCKDCPPDCYIDHGAMKFISEL